MKLLLDENLPIKLKFNFDDSYEVFSVGEKGWAGKKNGELLGLMLYNGFDALVTIDKNLIYQQNISKFNLKIFILDAINNKHHELQPYIEKRNKILKEGITEQITIIKIN